MRPEWIYVAIVWIGALRFAYSIMPPKDGPDVAIWLVHPIAGAIVAVVEGFTWMLMAVAFLLWIPVTLVRAARAAVRAATAPPPGA